MRRRDQALGLGLRAAVRRHGRGRILLDVRARPCGRRTRRRSTGGRAARRPPRRPGDVLGAVDRDLAGVGTVLAVGGVDDDVGPHALEERPHGFGVADLHALGRGVGPQANERRAEIPRRTGDVKAHACTLSGLRLRLAPMRRTFLWINFGLSSLIVVGVFVQAYLITAYVMGAGEDALDAHGVLGALFIPASSCSSS